MTDAYRDADNGSRSLIGVSLALLALTTVFFVGFVYSRFYHNGVGITQLMFWLIVSAYIFNAGNAIDNALSAILGDAGKHVDTLDPDTNIASGKIGKAADYLYIPSAVLPKLAMLAFFHHIFPGRICNLAIYGCALLLVFTLLAGVLQTTLICKPFAAYWHGNGTCGDLMSSYRWLSYPNLLTDLVMLVIPLPALLKLQASKATKFKLILAFLTGSLGIITAILRMVSFYTIPIFDDPTYNLIQPSIYSVAEPSAYLICAIMPTLRHLTRRSAPKTTLNTPITSTTSSSAPKPHKTTYTRNPSRPGSTKSKSKPDPLTLSTMPSTPSTAAPSYRTSILSRLSTFSNIRPAHFKSGTPSSIAAHSEPDLELGKVGLSPRARRATSNRTEVGTGAPDAHRGHRRGRLPSDAIVCETDINMVSEPLGRGLSGGWGDVFGSGMRGVEEGREGEEGEAMEARSVARSCSGSLEMGKGVGMGASLGVDGDVDGDEVPLNGVEGGGGGEAKVRTRKRKSIVAAVL